MSKSRLLCLIMVFAFAVGCAGLTTFAPASAGTGDDIADAQARQRAQSEALRNEQAAVAKRLREASSAFAKEQAQQAQLALQLKMAQGNLDSAKSIAEKLQNRLDKAQAEKKQIQESLDAASDRVVTTHNIIVQLARETISSNDDVSPVSLVLASKSHQDLLKNVNDNATIASIISRFSDDALIAKTLYGSKAERIELVNRKIEGLKIAADQALELIKVNESKVAAAKAAQDARAAAAAHAKNQAASAKAVVNGRLQQSLAEQARLDLEMQRYLEKALSGPVDLTGFDPGYIISDAKFFNFNGLDAGTVQGFLEMKGEKCKGEWCIKNFHVTADQQYGGNAECPGVIHQGETFSAAQALVKVQSVCGVTAKVLMVTLQKEQGLISRTDFGDNPGKIYGKALGFGCPDNGKCDPSYGGLLTQLYSAARQFKRYAGNTPRWDSLKHLGVNQILLHPTNAWCGTQAVNLKNQATVGLYIYTPYVPNQAAINAGLGKGDSCSSYGNRNFYIYYNDWFGSPK